MILAERMKELSPSHFWAGGGHVDCKVRLDFAEGQLLHAAHALQQATDWHTLAPAGI